VLISVLPFLALLVGGPYAVYLVWYALIQPTGCPANKSFKTESVSVVLPTYNEESIVASKLKELVNVEYPADQFEVIIVDSSTDNTAEVIQEFADTYDSLSIQVIIESERRGVATAVNMGVDIAEGDVIFRTDCDSRIGKKTIQHAVAALQDPQIRGVMGQQTEVLGESQVETDYRNLQARNQALESYLDSTFIVHGPCFAFRRADFEPIHPDSLADDTEVGVNIRRQGKRVILDPEMEFIESGVSNIRGRRQRKDRRAMGLIQMLVRSRDMIGGYGWYGRVVLPFNWWFMIVAPWLMLVLVVGGIVAGFSWFGTGGVSTLIALVMFVLLGQRDVLGPLQPLYAVFDSNISLIIASLRLLRGEGDGTWEVDIESRDAFEE
jgi:cellulose synthase/poly-beta-1,6-N-acetylglucosamine synthase-like glycosyltransferase